jgi:hypothetical protein
MNTNTLINSMQLLDDNTVEVVFKDEVLIDLEGIKNTFSQLEEVMGGRKMKKLIVTGRRTEITPEARRYGHERSLQLKHTVVAEAIIVHSLAQKMVINLYSQFIKDSYPTRYFTSFDKAKSWLNSFDTV